MLKKMILLPLVLLPILSAFSKDYQGADHYFNEIWNYESGKFEKRLGTIHMSKKFDIENCGHVKVTNMERDSEVNHLFELDIYTAFVDPDGTIGAYFGKPMPRTNETFEFFGKKYTPKSSRIEYPNGDKLYRFIRYEFIRSCSEQKVEFSGNCTFFSSVKAYSASLTFDKDNSLKSFSYTRSIKSEKGSFLIFGKRKIDKDWTSQRVFRCENGVITLNKER